jgi:hypothetical protein
LRTRIDQASTGPLTTADIPRRQLKSPPAEVFARPVLFPTAIRAGGTSIVNGIGNIAGAVMPFLAVALFAKFGLAGVFGMVAVMYALLVVASQLAPETQDQTLERPTKAPSPWNPPPPRPDHRRRCCGAW